MSENYRVRVKKGDQEFEVESTSKEYVDTKLKELISQADLDTKQSTRTQTRQDKKRKPRKGAGTNEGMSGSEAKSIDIPGIINHIKEADDFDIIDSKVLDKQNRLPKIMMCMYHAAKFKHDSYLTTGQVEQITDQLGVKIKTSNVSTAIKDNLKYFNNKNVRKKGQVVYYKLNRNGEKAFEKILKGNDI